LILPYNVLRPIESARAVSVTVSSRFATGAVSTANVTSELQSCVFMCARQGTAVQEAASTGCGTQKRR